MSGGTWAGVFSVALVIILILVAIEYVGTELKKRRNDK